MRDDGVAKPRIWQVRQHRGLHRGHHFACLGANHRESDYAIVTADKGFHKSLRFIGRVGPQHGTHRQSRDAHGNAVVLRLALGQPHMGQLRIGEHAVRHQAVARTAIPPGQIVLDDPKVVDGNVREVRAAGTFPDRPDIGCGRLQPLIDADVAASIQFDPSLVEADLGGA